MLVLSRSNPFETSLWILLILTLVLTLAGCEKGSGDHQSQFTSNQEPGPVTAPTPNTGAYSVDFSKSSYVYTVYNADELTALQDEGIRIWAEQTGEPPIDLTYHASFKQQGSDFEVLSYDQNMHKTEVAFQSMFPGTYTAKLRLNHACSVDSSCDHPLHTPPETIIQINHLADKIAMKTHAQKHTFFANENRQFQLRVSSYSSDTIDAFHVDVYLPKDTIYSLAQESIAELNIHDISETGFTFSTPRSRQGKNEYVIDFLKNEIEAFQINIHHDLFPSGNPDYIYDGVLPETLTSNLEPDQVQKTEIQLFLLQIDQPLSLKKAASCGAWLNIDSDKSVVTHSGFTPVEIELNTQALQVGEYICALELGHSEVTKTYEYKLNVIQ